MKRILTLVALVGVLVFATAGAQQVVLVCDAGAAAQCSGNGCSANDEYRTLKLDPDTKAVWYAGARIANNRFNEVVEGFAKAFNVAWGQNEVRWDLQECASGSAIPFLCKHIVHFTLNRITLLLTLHVGRNSTSYQCKLSNLKRQF